MKMNQAPPDYLPSIIPELKTFGLTIDFQEGEPHLAEDDFIVSVGKNRKPGTVYQIVAWRKVESKKNPCRYAFRVVKCPELVKKVHVNFRWEAVIEGPNVTALVIIWNPRNKKK